MWRLFSSGPKAQVFVIKVRHPNDKTRGAKAKLVGEMKVKQAAMVTAKALEDLAVRHNCPNLQVVSLEDEEGIEYPVQADGRFYVEGSEEQLSVGIYYANTIVKSCSASTFLFTSDGSSSSTGGVERQQLNLSDKDLVRAKLLVQSLDAHGTAELLDVLSQQRDSHDVLCATFTVSEALIRYMVAVCPDAVYVVLDCHTSRGQFNHTDKMVAPGPHTPIQEHGHMHTGAYMLARHLPFHTLLALCSMTEETLVKKPRDLRLQPIASASSRAGFKKKKQAKQQQQQQQQSQDQQEQQPQQSPKKTSKSKKKSAEAPPLRNLIFCGHSLSGCVAHAAAILARMEYLSLSAAPPSPTSNNSANNDADHKEGKESNKHKEPTLEVRAIAFSSPLCISPELAHYLTAEGQDMNHVTFCSETDPIPELATLSAELSAARHILPSSSGDEQQGGSSSSAASLPSSSSQANAIIPATKQLLIGQDTDSGLASVVKGALTVVRVAEQELFGSQSEVSLAPFGQFCFLRKGGTSSSLGISTSGRGFVVQQGSSTSIRSDMRQRLANSLGHSKHHYHSLIRTYLPKLQFTNYNERVMQLLALCPVLMQCELNHIENCSRMDVALRGLNLESILGRDPTKSLTPLASSSPSSSSAPTKSASDSSNSKDNTQAQQREPLPLNLCDPAFEVDPDAEMMIQNATPNEARVFVTDCKLTAPGVVRVCTDFGTSPPFTVLHMNTVTPPPSSALQFASVNMDLLQAAFLRGLLIMTYDLDERLSNAGVSGFNLDVSGALDGDEKLKGTIVLRSSTAGTNVTMHPLLMLLTDLEQYLLDSESRRLRSIIKEFLEKKNPSELYFARAEAAIVIKDMIEAISKPFITDGKLAQVVKKIGGAIGTAVGGVLAGLGVLLGLPGALLGLPALALTAGLSRVTRSDGPTIGVIAALLFLPPAILMMPGFAAVGLGAFLLQRSLQAFKDPITRHYLQILKILLLALNGNPDRELEEVSCLEVAVCDAYSKLSAGQKLYAASKEQVEQCVNAIYKELREQAKNNDPGRRKFLLEIDESFLVRFLLVAGKFAALRASFQNHFVVSFVGVHNSGKSTMIQQLFGFDTKASIIQRTESVTLYRLGSGDSEEVSQLFADPDAELKADSERLVIDVADFPGATDERLQVANLTRRMGEITTLFVCVFYAGHVAEPERKIVDTLKEKGKDIIVLLNQFDRLESEEELQDENKKAELKKRHAQALGLNEEQIIYTSARQSESVEFVRHVLFGHLKIYAGHNNLGSLALLLLRPDVRARLAQASELRNHPLKAQAGAVAMFDAGCSQEEFTPAQVLARGTQTSSFIQSGFMSFRPTRRPKPSSDSSTPASSSSSSTSPARLDKSTTSLVLDPAIQFEIALTELMASMGYSTDACRCVVFALTQALLMEEKSAKTVELTKKQEEGQDKEEKKDKKKEKADKDTEKEDGGTLEKLASYLQEESGTAGLMKEAIVSQVLDQAEQFQSLINQLVEMGFNSRDVVEAIKTCIATQPAKPDLSLPHVLDEVQSIAMLEEERLLQLNAMDDFEAVASEQEDREEEAQGGKDKEKEKDKENEKEKERSTTEEIRKNWVEGSSLLFLLKKKINLTVVDKLSRLEFFPELASESDQQLSFERCCSLFRRALHTLAKENNPNENSLTKSLTRTKVALASGEQQLSSLLSELTALNVEELRKGLRFEVEGEKAMDLGGVLRSVFSHAATTLRQGNHPQHRSLLSPVHSHYVYFSPSLHSDPPEEAASKLEALGRLLGLCIVHSLEEDVRMPNCFPLPVFKLILGEPLDLDDFYLLHPDICKQIKAMCFMDSATLRSLELCFGVDISEDEGYDLVENGLNVLVTERNRLDYLLKYVFFYLGAALPLRSFVRGVQQVCPRHLLTLFTPAMLQMLVSGVSEFSVEQMKRLTNVSSQFLSGAGGMLLDWFWECVEEMTSEERALLLAFITGSSSLPPEGSGAALAITLTLSKASKESLPVAHTCFNTLVLPEYPDKGTLQRKLQTAIHEGGTQHFGLV
ncbi:hypothetical protein QOT17_016668 [Balamuthia mandrillaris]